MGVDENEGFNDSSLELLRTQATFCFFALPNEPSDVLDPLIDNLITLIGVILSTCGEDGRSWAEQLLQILKQIDQYVCSPMEYQRKRGCRASYKMLLKFRTLCMSGYCVLGCQGCCTHKKQIDRTPNRSLSSFPSAYLLPSRNALRLGDMMMFFLPRCTDTNSEVRKTSA